MIQPYLSENVLLPLSGRVTRSDFWRLVRQIRQSQDWPAEEIRRHQAWQLGELIEAAVHETDFWPERLSDSDAYSDAVATRLRGLPLTTKADLESGFPDRVVSRSANQADLRFAATRGTTQRMICVHDFAKRDSIRAAMVVTLRAAGYRIGMPMVEMPPKMCDVVCGEMGERDEGVLSYLWRMARSGWWRDDEAYRDLRGLIERRWVYNRKTYAPLSETGACPTNDKVDETIDRLRTDKPYLLKGLTTYLYQIAKRVVQSNAAPLAIPVIKPLGSGTTATMWSAIEQALGGRFVDDYGTAELGAIAYGCGEGEGMHLFTNLFIVEVVDHDGCPVAPGEVGEVVITDLVNHAMPLIRYRVGDLGRIIPEPCPCGRRSPRIQIEGRVQDAIRLPQGGWATSHAIAEKFFQQPWVDQFQLVEKRSGLIELTIATTNQCELDRPAASAILAELLGGSRRVSVTRTPSIAAESSGKFRWVKAQPRTT